MEPALRSGVLTISAGAALAAPPLSSPPLISAPQTMGSPLIMVAGATSPGSILKCQKQHLLKLPSQQQISFQFSIGGNH